MKTKTRREHQLRAIARLCAQARLNVGDCDVHGRVAESMAWRDVLAYLQYIGEYVRAHGLPVQPTLWEEAVADAD